MSRRNKKGQRARVVGEGVNDGVVVLVIRPYFFPEMFDGATWRGFRFPWVVTSLGRPLQSSYLDGSTAPPTQSGVVNDENLEPLDDDPDEPSETQDLDIPITCVKPAEEMAK